MFVVTGYNVSNDCVDSVKVLAVGHSLEKAKAYAKQTMLQVFVEAEFNKDEEWEKVLEYNGKTAALHFATGDNVVYGLDYAEVMVWVSKADRF